MEDLTPKIKEKNRFKFGKNWKEFLKSLNQQKINFAKKCLLDFLEEKDLNDKTFLDIGSGSGLSSLAAKTAGANVYSFDYDIDSVACTEHLKHTYFSDDSKWKIKQGSALDAKYLESLGKFDIVYSWGVLHHTGEMWRALENVVELVKRNGSLFIALYNYQQFASSYWTFVKRTYNSYRITRPFWILVHFLYPTLPSIALKLIQNRKAPRGMTIWYDLIDWLGGYPFEVSTPKEIFNFYKANGFTLTQITTVGGKLGCNEYVFRRTVCKC